jgi:hypothetical protein
MTEQPIEKLGWPGLPKAIALLVLFGLSGGIVWSFHNTEGTTFIAALVFGCFFGFLAGGLVGVPMIPSLGMMAVYGGILEGIVQGWTHYGYVGAFLGALFGIVAGFIVMLLPTMLTHFVMIVCGKDPLMRISAHQSKRR